LSFLWLPKMGKGQRNWFLDIVQFCWIRNFSDEILILVWT
jgi:hypothetical protein